MDTGLATLPAVDWLNAMDSASLDGCGKMGFGDQNYLVTLVKRVSHSKDVSLEAGLHWWVRW